MKDRAISEKNYFYLFIIGLLLGLFNLFLSGCGDKIQRLDDKLRRTIYEGEKGRIKNIIDMKVGFKTEVDSILIKPTYKEDYTYYAIVTFRAKNMEEETKRKSLPKLGGLPSTNKNQGQVKGRFQYLEFEDRWYFQEILRGST